MNSITDRFSGRGPSRTIISRAGSPRSRNCISSSLSSVSSPSLSNSLNASAPRPISARLSRWSFVFEPSRPPVSSRFRSCWTIRIRDAPGSRSTTGGSAAPACCCSIPFPKIGLRNSASSKTLSDSSSFWSSLRSRLAAWDRSSAESVPSPFASIRAKVVSWSDSEGGRL